MQGKFAAMDAVLINADDLSEAAITRYAATVGLDRERFVKDSGGTAIKSVDDDITSANKMGVTCTPAFYLCSPTGEVLKLSSLNQLPSLIR